METNTLFDYDAGGSSLWRKTLERCEGKLYQEVVNEIQSCKGVKDLIVFVNEESERRSSTVLKFLEKVKYFGDHFKAYQILSTSFVKELLTQDVLFGVLLGPYSLLVHRLTANPCIGDLETMLTSCRLRQITWKSTSDYLRHYMKWAGVFGPRASI